MRFRLSAGSTCISISSGVRLRAATRAPSRAMSTAVLFPIPILLGSLRGEGRHTLLIASFAAFFTLGLILFGNVHPLF